MSSDSMASWDPKPSRMRCVCVHELDACEHLLLPPHPPALSTVRLTNSSQQASQLLASPSPLLQVFERVARNVVAGTMEGYNGTVFAYGQTGSGKTFTITGGPERYVDRGIIPRSLSLVYNEVAKRSDYQFTVSMCQSVCRAAVLCSSGAGRSAALTTWAVSLSATSSLQSCSTQPVKLQRRGPGGLQGSCNPGLSLQHVFSAAVF